MFQRWKHREESTDTAGIIRGPGSAEGDEPVARQVVVPSHAPQYLSPKQVAQDLLCLKLAVNAKYECLEGAPRPSQRQRQWVPARIEIGRVREPERQYMRRGIHLRHGDHRVARPRLRHLAARS